MNLIDTHTHLYWDSFKEDFNKVIQRTVSAGISAIINVGVDPEKSQVALEQSKNTKWPKGLTVYSTIGIHPHEALKYESSGSLQKDIEKIEQIYSSSPETVVAVGECGLDYYFRDIGEIGEIRELKKIQKRLFQAQIELAKKLNLPLIIHCRDDRSQNPQNSECWDDALEMIGDDPAILHCYSGLPHTTNYILPATNLLVSFAANITYPKNEYLRQAATILPLDKVLLETDAPFLAPQSKRGQRNEPSAVAEIAQLIADLKGISIEEVASQTTQNAKIIFKIN